MNRNDVFSVDTPEESSGFLLWQVTTLWQRGIRSALEEYDLTHSQFVLLASIMWLSAMNEPITQIVLSNHSKIDPMTTSTVIRTLMKKELVVRKEHEQDTRAKAVSLTPRGAALVKMAIKKVEDFDRAFFSILEENTTGFNRQLHTLLEA